MGLGPGAARMGAGRLALQPTRRPMSETLPVSDRVTGIRGETAGVLAARPRDSTRSELVREVPEFKGGRRHRHHPDRLPTHEVIRESEAMAAAPPERLVVGPHRSPSHASGS